MVESQKHLSPRTINSHPLLAGMKRHDLDLIEQVKARYSYRMFLQKDHIFLQNARFFCKFIETRWKILRYIRSDVSHVGLTET